MYICTLLQNLLRFSVSGISSRFRRNVEGYTILVGQKFFEGYLGFSMTST